MSNAFIILSSLFWKKETVSKGESNMFTIYKNASKKTWPESTVFIVLKKETVSKGESKNVHNLQEHIQKTWPGSTVYLFSLSFTSRVLEQKQLVETVNMDGSSIWVNSREGTQESFGKFKSLCGLEVSMLFFK